MLKVAYYTFPYFFQTEHKIREERWFKSTWTIRTCKRASLYIQDIKALKQMGDASTGWGISLDLCCSVWMNECICPALFIISGSGWWCCNAMRDIFLVHFGPPSYQLSIGGSSMESSQTSYLNIALKWPPQSQALSSIEHLWDVVERDIQLTLELR